MRRSVPNPSKPSTLRPGPRRPAGPPVRRTFTAEFLAELTRSAELIHEKYRLVENRLEQAIDLVVSHMESQTLIEDDLTPRDWETIAEARVRVAARRAAENERARLAGRDVNRFRRHSSVPTIPKPNGIAPAPWYEDDRFPKPYRMRYLCVTNGFTDVADGFAKFVNSYATPSALVFTNAKTPQINPETKKPRYTHKVELSGFTDAQISLKFDEEHVLILAERPKGVGVNHRETIEVIYLPKGICADHLKIARDGEGTLWIEERPHYAISSGLNF